MKSERGKLIVSAGVKTLLGMIIIMLLLFVPAGSWLYMDAWRLMAVLVFAFYVPVIVLRIVDEERLLLAELDGYDNYCKQTRWRLIPFVW